MKRAIRLISVGASVALLWAAQSCNFAAGLKTGGAAVRAAPPTWPARRAPRAWRALGA